MDSGKIAQRGRRILIATAMTAAVLVLLPFAARAQKSEVPKRILVLYWYNRDWPGNVSFDQNFQAVLQSAPAGTVEYYSEYLESNRFPGENQSQLLRDYLRQKYADRAIDVIVAVTDAPLEFLLKYRDDLFTNTPIVFVAVKSPSIKEFAGKAGLTGITHPFNYKHTLDLVLKLQPDTTQVFFVSGTLEHDKRFEKFEREELQGYANKVSISYLTDLSPKELIERTKTLPKRSVIIYVYQQWRDEQGKVLETSDILSLVTKSATVPIYGMSSWQIGGGIVGGYLRTLDANGTRAAEIALQIVNGTRPQDIPLESTPEIPMFDARELERWGISESSLPPGSVVRFRETSFWEEYKWYVIGFASVIAVQSMLITALLINRSRRKRAEIDRERFAQLAESERQRLDEVVSNVPGIVWESLLQAEGKTGQAIFVSEYAEKMLGYPVDEWLSTPDFAESLTHQDDREEVVRVTEAIAANGKEGRLQYRVIANDGREFWVETHLAPIRDETRKVIGLRGITMDVTSRKLAEAALIENEAKLGAIVGSAMDAIITIDQRRCVVLFNAAAEKMFGCPANEALGSSLDRFIPERFRDRHIEHIRNFEETGATTRSIGSDGLYGCRTNGAEFPMEASVSQLELQGQRFYTVILRDVTQSRLAIAALQESEERFRNMADTAPVMIWVSGPDKLCTYFNQQWLSFSGRSLEEELGYGWANSIHPEDFERCIETYNRAFDLHQPFRVEYRVRRADGQYRWVLDSGTPRFASGGKFLGYIGSRIDISDLKAAEEALENLSGQLIRAREDECARIARELHDDVNQRMALISIELEQIGQTLPDNRHPLRTQLEGVLSHITETSKEIHRMSYDLHPSKLTHLGLVAALESLSEELRKRHGLRIDFTHQDVPVDLPKDMSLCLYRIVQECLNNVIRHSGAKRARVELVGTSSEIKLLVSDSGVGFDFESPKLKKGLGLVGMRERLRLVGGIIVINSQPSLGARIDATIPLKRIARDQHGWAPDDKMRASGN
jgi:PAS domain S-box-containing protein